MRGESTDISNSLRQLRLAVSATDLSHHDASSLRSLIGELRLTERSLTALGVKAARQSDALAAEGSAPDAEETLLSSGQVSGSTARKERDRSRIANNIPQAGNALDQGDIGAEHLDALNRARKTIEPELQELFDQCAGDLINRTNNTPVDTFNKQIRRLTDKITNDHGLATAQKQRETSELRTWKDRNGMGHIRGQFDPELFEQLTSSIARETAAIAKQAKADSDQVTFGPHLDALALIELISHGNGRKGRPDITLILDANTVLNGPHEESVRETIDGNELAYETIRRLCCDANVRNVVLDTDGTPIDVGRQYRTATRRQWVALEAIYSCCAWAGCDRPITWCQAHHIDEWENGGNTDLDNLIPLCSRHHHAVHEGQWTIKLLPDRTLRIFTPDGKAHGTATPDRLSKQDTSAPPPGHRQPCNN